ncbi:MAG: adenosylcobinamide-GDP ribazoletransferase [Chloroflexi bacterium]|nr:adenosylcobinamide-GDP ribazoletransferase [Chloroflexota bacterium]
MRLLAALHFLTVLRLPWVRESRPDELGRSTAYFPLVGLFVGLALAGLYWLLGQALPAPLVTALLVASMAALTGAMHLDGFIDTCDGIAGHRTVEERWRIMHDSRAGGIGVAGVIILLLVKYASLSSVPPALMMASLVLMATVSRWGMTYAVFAYPYARPSGMGKAFKEGAGWPGFVIATLITVAVALALWPALGLSSLFALVAAWVVIVAVASYLKRKLSGLTGDTYGAINEIAEITVLVVIILLAHRGLAQ